MELGTVIHGTHRPEDLIPAFYTLAARLVGEGYRKGLVLERARRWISADVEERPSLETNESAEELIYALMDLLDACAPEGYYFGSHPGNGSDFGFWKLEEWTE